MSTILKALRQLEDDKAQTQRSLLEDVVEPDPSASPRAVNRARAGHGRTWIGVGLALCGAGLLAYALVPSSTGVVDPESTVTATRTQSVAPSAQAPAPSALARATGPLAAQPGSGRQANAGAEAGAMAVEGVEAPSRGVVVADLSAHAAGYVAPGGTARDAVRPAAALPTSPGAISAQEQRIASPELSPSPATATAPIGALAAAAASSADRPSAIERPAGEPEVVARAATSRGALPPGPVRDPEPRPAPRGAAPVTADPWEPDFQVIERPPELLAPEVLVASTVWHPRAWKREVEIVGEDGGAQRLREGDALGDYVVVEITPSAVVFGRSGQIVKLGIGER